MGYNGVLYNNPSVANVMKQLTPKKDSRSYFIKQIIPLESYFVCVIAL